MSLTELPYGLPGRVFRSQMPFSSFDPSGALIEKYGENGIAAIILLAGEREIFDRTNLDLKKLYTERGYAVLHLPIDDYGVPSQESIRTTVKAAYELARQGQNIAIHCYAGIGRTGTFAACLAHQALGLRGEAAIEWVRERVPGAVESSQQRDVVLKFQPEEG
jgi:protein-tyrosine phosphatase